MHHILSFFFWFVRLGPLALGGVAVAVLGLGFYLQIGQSERNALTAAALIAGPPAAVDVAKFDRDQHMTELREVVLRGQAVMDFAYELTIEKDSGYIEGFMVPLVSETASSQTDVVGVAFFHDKSFGFEDLTPEFLMRSIVDFGTVGPVMEYNGKISSLGTWDELTREAFHEEGLTFRDDLVIVWPFIDGREVAFAAPDPGDQTIFDLMSWIAGLIGLLALGKLVFGSKTNGPEPDTAPVSHAATPIANPAPVKSGVPLCKQRSGIVDDADPMGEPATFEVPDVQTMTFVTDPAAEPAIRPQRSKWGVRKVLIGVVGGLFVLGLVATVSDLIAKSSGASTDTVTVTSAKDIAVQTLADVLVRDAAPNRHWTDIDVTPVVEWFVAQAMLAFRGDMNAQMNLGMVIGGLFFGMFMLRFFFMMRRSLRPKTSSLFDSMGLN